MGANKSGSAKNCEPWQWNSSERKAFKETGNPDSKQEKPQYEPPVGPKSRSKPPSGTWRDHSVTRAMTREIQGSRGPKLEVDSDMINFDSSRDVFPETAFWMSDVELKVVQLESHLDS